MYHDPPWPPPKKSPVDNKAENLSKGPHGKSGPATNYLKMTAHSAVTTTTKRHQRQQKQNGTNRLAAGRFFFFYHRHNGNTGLAEGPLKSFLRRGKSVKNGGAPGPPHRFLLSSGHGPGQGSRSAAVLDYAHLNFPQCPASGRPPASLRPDTHRGKARTAQPNRRVAWTRRKFWA